MKQLSAYNPLGQPDHKMATPLGWLLGVAAALLYGLTAAPTVSFWDCGEFIATSFQMGVGHPPGAPLYQLLAHLFTLLASAPERVAFWSNLLSALAGGATVMFLFWTLCRLSAFLPSAPADSPAAEGLPTFGHRFLSCVPALVGSLCYCFCDTAWFSAVESEVYSLAMLFAAVVFWASIRWAADRLSADPARNRYASRWLLLIALLLGLSFCVHLMCWLAAPAVLLLVLLVEVRLRRQMVVHQTTPGSLVRLLLGCALLFLLGLTPYVVIPLRAAANPPINNSAPATAEAFRSYLRRDQYENGPALYPRIWRTHPSDAQYYADWSGGRGLRQASDGRLYCEPNVADNIQFLATYQLNYMYLRYLMWNFSGRYNDRQGFGTLQNGQFITGFPFLDRFLVGTGKMPPASLPGAGHNVYFMIPLLLGLWGLCYHYRRHKPGFWVVAVLFLFSGVGLAVYLNMPAYQPRERDYAFVLSFYAFCIWIGLGAQAAVEAAYRCMTRKGRKAQSFPAGLTLLLPCLLLLVPGWMLVQNLDDHDRHDNYLAHDTARNMLNSCRSNAILFTFGDNDTFPLWYIQEVEKVRPDVQVVNLSLLTTPWYASQMFSQLSTPSSSAPALPLSEDGDIQVGMRAFLQIFSADIRESDSAADSIVTLRPLYFSHYAYDDYKDYFDGYFQLCGMLYKLNVGAALGRTPCDSVACDEFYDHVAHHFSWRLTDSQATGVDATSQKFLNLYFQNCLLLAENLISQGRQQQGAAVLQWVERDIPLAKIDDLTLRHRFVAASVQSGRWSPARATAAYQLLRKDLDSQLRYYHSIPRRQQSFIPYTLQPLEVLARNF